MKRCTNCRGLGRARMAYCLTYQAEVDMDLDLAVQRGEIVQKRYHLPSLSVLRMLSIAARLDHVTCFRFSRSGAAPPSCRKVWTMYRVLAFLQKDTIQPPAQSHVYSNTQATEDVPFLSNSVLETNISGSDDGHMVQIESMEWSC